MLTRKTYIKTKWISLNLRLHNLRQLPKSKITKNKKMLIYKRLIYPEITYSVQVWRTIRNSNLKTIQPF